MAEKQVPLSIVLHAVDQATAKINAISKRLDAVTKPTRDLGKALKDLGESSGLNDVIGGFKGVGGAVRDLFGTFMVGVGLVGAAGLALHSLVEHFDDLGDKSEKLQVTVDFLAGMRHAAERSGASIQDLDEGLTTFGANMGQLRGGTGRMLKALQAWAPDLIPMLKATKGNEAAFRLLADAMSKITDPQKRMALAMKTVGNTNLVPMLARSSSGLLELQGEFIGNAGSMEDAAEGAGKVDDALKKVKAATEGVKAAIMTGLSPALDTLLEQLRVWLVDHREDIAKWAKELGDELPAAVDAVVKAVKDAVAWLTSFVEDIGGIKVAALGLVAVLVGPLVSSFATLGLAILATPFGWILASLAAIVVAIDQVIKHWDDLKAALDPTDRRTGAGGISDALTRLPGFAPTGTSTNAAGLLGAIPGVSPAALATATGSAPAAQGGAVVKVDFVNAPKGMRATVDPQGASIVDLSVGHNMLGGFP